MQVQHGEDGRGPLRQQLGGRHPVGDAGVADLALGPDQPLGHRSGRHQEGAGDLRRWSARPACAGSARPGPPAGSAGWQQVKISRSRSSGPRRSSTWTRVARRQPPPAAWPRSVADRRSRSIARLRAVVVSQAPGRSRHAVAPPPVQRPRERVLGALLGEVPVARHPDQGGDDPTPLVAERRSDRVVAAGHRHHRPDRSDLDRRRTARSGAWTRSRWPRPGPRTRSRRSRRPAPWSPRTGRPRRSSSPSRTRTVVASATGRSRSPISRTWRSVISSTHGPGFACSGLSSTSGSTQTRNRYFMSSSSGGTSFHRCDERRRVGMYTSR